MTPLQAAEARLLQVMATIAPMPPYAAIAPDGTLPRIYEARLEGIAPHRELFLAYSTFKRALRSAQPRHDAHLPKKSRPHGRTVSLDEPGTRREPPELPRVDPDRRRPIPPGSLFAEIARRRALHEFAGV